VSDDGLTAVLPSARLARKPRRLGVDSVDRSSRVQCLWWIVWRPMAVLTMRKLTVESLFRGSPYPYSPLSSTETHQQHLPILHHLHERVITRILTNQYPVYYLPVDSKRIFLHADTSAPSIRFTPRSELQPDSSFQPHIPGLSFPSLMPYQKHHASPGIHLSSVFPHQTVGNSNKLLPLL
jgi:hypothetical protein